MSFSSGVAPHLLIMSSLVKEIVLLVVVTVYQGLMISVNASVQRTINIDAAYKKWDKTQPIPYYINPAFTPAEFALIQTAISTLQSQITNCGITFKLVARTDASQKLHITPLTGESGSAAQQVCFSYPGIYLAQQALVNEQILSIARGSLGCLDGSLHSIMKYLVVSLGKRNEHQRGDRDKFITMSPDSSLTVPTAYKLYTTKTTANGSGDATWLSFPEYDYCSITHNQPTDYGNPAFTVKPGTLPGFIPKLDTISLLDCKWLSALYNCTSTCPQPACSTITTPAPSSTTAAATTTTAAVTTTTAAITTTAPVTTTPVTVPCNPAVNFCTAKIDEGSLLYDGRTFIFSGDCAQQLDSTTGKPTGAPQKLGSLFNGGTPVVGPVQSVWTDATAGVQTTHILLQTGTQYACSAAIPCATETAASNSQGAFEFDFTAGTYAGYQIDAVNLGADIIPISGGTTIHFIDVYLNCLFSTCPNVGDMIPFHSPAGVTGAWKSVYRGQPVVALIGPNYPGVNQIGTQSNQQIMYMKADPNTPGSWILVDANPVSLPDTLCPPAGAC